ncbi:fimbrillin family protein [Sphingobacterium sp. SGL-16]|uniref:fimbrillin family protein n=1 Tax=Sphingobacterium sp. SGL-16 TaxID=2710883 RepID=UPI0013EA3CF7|nr:fimbrillin family protein [Sphingobacterium sp. SGL-16]NGM73860.1 fimbrillin family protein [Sphingobacterium sp. SGL-16]
MKRTKILIKKYLLILIGCACLAISCSKTSVDQIPPVEIPEGYAAIHVEMVDIQFQEEDLGDKKNASVHVNNNLVSLSGSNKNGFTCTAVLEPVSNSSNNLKTSLNGISKQTETKTKEVEKNIHYRVYAYNKATGALATSKNYIRGQESTQGPLMVYGGNEYVIVAYSINSKTEYPAEIENSQNINTAEITNGQVEFMFQKQDITVAHNSTNTIKFKFRHQFAQINTIIKLDTETSVYTQIRGAGGASYFQPSYSTTKFKVSNSNITGVNLSPQGSPVNFPFIPFNDLNVKTIASLKPTILNTPTSITNGKFTIEALTIGDVTRHVEISDLNLMPGVKYNLVLTFNVPETTLIGANPYFHFVDSVTTNVPFTHTLELENPTFGAQIDIWNLDNSFNLNINGQNLFSRELNFEGFPLHDVYFSDLTYYGSRDIPSSNPRISVIYRINEGSATRPREEIPVVRLTIDQFGNVRLFGRKRMSENLRELFIRPDVTINPLARLIPNGINT